jgi:hypothetical protein
MSPALFPFLMIAVLTGVKWNLKVVLICIYLMAAVLTISSYTFWPFVLLPLENLYSVHLSIFSLLPKFYPIFWGV